MGLKKVFIDCGADVIERNNIASVIEKAKLADLVVIDTVEEAEVVLQFDSGKEKRPSSYRGDIYLVIRWRDPKVLRLLLSVDVAKDRLWKSSPSTRFAKEFVRAYKTANRLK